MPDEHGNINLDDMCQVLEDFADMVGEMRKLQRVDRFRESITQSAERCRMEDRVDAFLELLVLDHPGPRTHTQKLNRLKGDPS